MQITLGRSRGESGAEYKPRKASGKSMARCQRNPLAALLDKLPLTPIQAADGNAVRNVNRLLDLVFRRGYKAAPLVKERGQFSPGEALNKSA